jgi:hypothetical protein
MAKEIMICPFSGTMCKECPVYRGRHYLLCYCEKYRGCLPAALKNLPMSKKSPNGKFTMPSLPTMAKDPFINELL